MGVGDMLVLISIVGESYLQDIRLILQNVLTVE